MCLMLSTVKGIYELPSVLWKGAEDIVEDIQIWLKRDQVSVVELL